MKMFLRFQKVASRFMRPLKNGANPVSLWLRVRVEHLHIKEIIGINLAGLTFFSAVILPQTTDIISTVQTDTTDPQTVIDVVPTTSTFQWPLTQFGISQRFSLFHPGIDMTAPNGTPIVSTAEGDVVWVNYFRWGYGNHVLIKHNADVQSLYAHLSRVFVKPGERVTKDTTIGEVGSTGWSTGNHLHLEIYQDSTPINPLEVLPEIK